MAANEENVNPAPQHKNISRFNPGPFEKDKMKWDTYEQRLNLYFRKMDITTPQDKKDELLLVCGYDAFEDVGTCFKPRRMLEDDTITYDMITEAFRRNVQPRQNESTATFHFHARKQQQDESITRALRDQLIVGVRDNDTRCLLLRTSVKTLDDALKLAEGVESSRQDAGAMQEQKSITTATTESAAAFSVMAVQPPGGSAPWQRRTCFRCTEMHHPNSCKYKKAKCDFCHNIGHIERACRNKKRAESQRGQAGQGNLTPSAGAVHYVQVEQPVNTPPQPNQPQQPQPLVNQQQYQHGSSANSTVSYVQPIYQPHSSQVNLPPEYSQFCIMASMTVPEASPPTYAQVLVDNVPCSMIVDNGAPFAIAPEGIFQQLWPHLQPQKVQFPLGAFNNTGIHITGKQVVKVTLAGHSAELPLYIAREGSVLILGREWFNALGIRLIMPQQQQVLLALEQARQPNQESLQQHTVSTLRTYPCFLPGLGTYKGPAIKIHLKPGAVPKFCRARSVPYARRMAVEQEIKRMINIGAWQPVRHSMHATPLVTVPKPNGQIRLCGDYRLTVNTLAHADKYPLPTIQDIHAALNGGRVFSKIDLDQAFTQLQVDDETSKILALNTPLGLMSVHRLPFGLHSAPNIFQREMEILFRNVKGVLVFLDDILVQGATQEEHDVALQFVLKTLSEVGLRVKLEKCKFSVPEVEFLGYIVSAEGIRPSPKNVEDLLHAPAPKTVEELRSFLGKITFYEKFIPDRATLFHPLYRLLLEKAEWSWGSNEEQAFKEAKQIIASPQVLTHYDLQAPLILSADASPWGVGCVLAHVLPDGERPIAFASRTLEKAEKNYSQFDKEALAIVFAVKKFHKFVAGRPFTILTDHKPLLGIFNRNHAAPSTLGPRLQRWVLLMEDYNYQIQYRPGKNHANADALSRLPVTGSGPSYVPEPPGVFLITEPCIDNILTAQLVAKETEADPILQELKNCLQSGNQLQGGPYEQASKKLGALSLAAGCILMGDRVIIPPSLKSKALQVLHADFAHQGVVHMKRLARILMWWPGIDQDIEEEALHCHECQANQPAKEKEDSEWPEAGAWERLHLDFAGPCFGGRHFMVLVDAGSRYPIVWQVPGPTAKAAITCLQSAFSTHGLPLTIVSDNGSAFISQDFQTFLAKNNIKFLSTATYCPQSNGRAERCVRSIKDYLRRAGAENFNDKLTQKLEAMRTTPSADGKSPAENLMGRRLRTTLSLVKPVVRYITTERSSYIQDQPVWTRVSKPAPKPPPSTWTPAWIIRNLGNKMAEVEDQNQQRSQRNFRQIRPRVLKESDCQYTVAHPTPKLLQTTQEATAFLEEPIKPIQQLIPDLEESQYSGRTSRRSSVSSYSSAAENEVNYDDSEEEFQESRSEEGSGESDSDSSEGPPSLGRPARQRRLPSHLRNYVLN